MTKPNASKQFKGLNVLRFEEDIAYGDGPYCWNCELGFKSLEDAPPDCPLHFCNPLCEREWASQQPLQNLLDKRRAKREREA